MEQESVAKMTPEKMVQIFQEVTSDLGNIDLLKLQNIVSIMQVHQSTLVGDLVAYGIRVLFSQIPDMVTNFERALSEKEVDREMRRNIACLEDRIKSYEKHTQASVFEVKA